MPVKKKIKTTKLVDLFNRASICLMTPEDRMSVFLRMKPFTENEDSSQVFYCFVPFCNFSILFIFMDKIILSWLNSMHSHIRLLLCIVLRNNIVFFLLFNIES